MSHKNPVNLLGYPYRFWLITGNIPDEAHIFLEVQCCSGISVIRPSRDSKKFGHREGRTSENNLPYNAM